MKLIKSYFIQLVGITMSIFMFLFFVFSFFFIKDDKYMLLLVTFFLGILFYILSTSRIEYDEYQIYVKLFIWKKKITISQIKAITYSGVPNVCTFECTSGVIYMPLFYPKRKMKELLEFIKKINPSIRVVKQIG